MRLQMRRSLVTVGMTERDVNIKVSPKNRQFSSCQLCGFAARTPPSKLKKKAADTSRVCLQAFAADLEQLFRDIDALDPTILVVEGPSGQAVSGSLDLDDGKMNKLLVQVSPFSPPCKRILIKPAGSLALS